DAAPQFATTFKASVPSLKALLAALGEEGVDGRLDAAAEISGSGRSLAEIMAHAAGETNILFGDGTLAAELAKRLPNEIVFGRPQAPSAEVNPEDPGASLRPSNDSLNVGCLVSRFDILGGRAHSHTFLLETAQAVTTGDGMIDLGKEALDLHLRPRPRDPAL